MNIIVTGGVGFIGSNFIFYMLDSKRQILMRSDTKSPQLFASWSNSL